MRHKRSGSQDAHVALVQRADRLAGREGARQGQGGRQLELLLGRSSDGASSPRATGPHLEELWEDPDRLEQVLLGRLGGVHRVWPAGGDRGGQRGRRRRAGRVSSRARPTDLPPPLCVPRRRPGPLAATPPHESARREQTWTAPVLRGPRRVSGWALRACSWRCICRGA